LHKKPLLEKNQQRAAKNNGCNADFAKRLTAIVRRKASLIAHRITMGFGNRNGTFYCIHKNDV
jgi:hypothetical protein